MARCFGNDKVGDLPPAEGSEKSLDRFMHRAFEVEAKSELRGEFYAVPHEERSCPAVAQSRIGPAGVIVNCRLVPNEIGARMDLAVGAAGQENIATTVLCTGAVQGQHLGVAVRKGRALPSPRFLVQLEQCAEIATFFHGDLLAGLPDFPAHAFRGVLPHGVQIGRVFDPVSIAGGLLEPLPVKGQPVGNFGMKRLLKAAQTREAID